MMMAPLPDTETIQLNLDTCNEPVTTNLTASYVPGRILVGFHEEATEAEPDYII